MSEASAAPVAKRPAPGLAERVRFRLATRDDAGALVAMINAAYMREAWLLPAPRIDVATLSGDIREPDIRLVVAEVEGVLAGSICLWLRGEAHFGLFAVATEWQGRGLASLLVAEAERLARDAAYSDLRLDCAKELGLRSFYETLGYAVEREVPGHYYGRDGVRKGPITRVDMVKRLR